MDAAISLMDLTPALVEAEVAKIRDDETALFELRDLVAELVAEAIYCEWKGTAAMVTNEPSPEELQAAVDAPVEGYEHTTEYLRCCLIVTTALYQHL